MVPGPVAVQEVAAEQMLVDPGAGPGVGLEALLVGDRPHRHDGVAGEVGAVNRLGVLVHGHRFRVAGPVKGEGVEVEDPFRIRRRDVLKLAVDVPFQVFSHVLEFVVHRGFGPELHPDQTAAGHIGLRNGALAELTRVNLIKGVGDCKTSGPALGKCRGIGFGARRGGVHRDPGLPVGGPVAHIVDLLYKQKVIPVGQQAAGPVPGGEGLDRPDVHLGIIGVLGVELVAVIPNAAPAGPLPGGRVFVGRRGGCDVWGAGGGPVNLQGGAFLRGPVSGGVPFFHKKRVYAVGEIRTVDELDGPKGDGGHGFAVFHQPTLKGPVSTPTGTPLPDWVRVVGEWG